MSAIRHRTSLLAILVITLMSCESAGPAAPVMDSVSPAFSNLSRTGSYELTLTCRKDAASAGNVGLDVFDVNSDRLFGGALTCGESINVGPGATWFHYNINVYHSFDYLFSCETPGVVALTPGNFRCTVRDAGFTRVEMNGIWVALRVRKL